MADTITLAAVPRSEIGTRAVRKMRKNGRIPAVLYGRAQEVYSLSVDTEEFEFIIRGGSRVVDLSIEDQSEPALIREVQWDTFGQEILHIDLTRVSLDERISVDIRVELRGTAKGMKVGGVVQHLVHQIPVSCYINAIPEVFQLNVNELDIGEALCVRDVAVLEGTNLEMDPDTVIVRVIEITDEETVESAEEGTGSAEPEIIGRADDAGDTEKAGASS